MIMNKKKCALTNLALFIPSFKFGSVSKTGAGAFITLLEPGTSLISVFVFLKGEMNFVVYTIHGKNINNTTR